MSLLEKIKQDQIAARKAKKGVESALLTTLLGEASAVGKNNGNRETTDAEVVAIIKKFIKNMDETISYLTTAKPSTASYAISTSDLQALNVVKLEKLVISEYLPKQLTEEELTAVIKSIVAEVGTNMGKVMATLKSKHEGLYDGKMASSLVKSLL